MCGRGGCRWPALPRPPASPPRTQQAEGQVRDLRTQPQRGTRPHPSPPLPSPQAQRPGPEKPQPFSTFEAPTASPSPQARDAQCAMGRRTRGIGEGKEIVAGSAVRKGKLRTRWRSKEALRERQVLPTPRPSRRVRFRGLACSPHPLPPVRGAPRYNPIFTSDSGAKKGSWDGPSSLSIHRHPHPTHTHTQLQGCIKEDGSQKDGWE